ncbi:MAG: M1 family aminopeptidase, partial [Planctomycetota bacterium]
RCGARIKNLRGCWNPRVAYRDDRGWRFGVEQFADYRVTVGPLPQPLIPISGKVVERRKDENGLWTITCEATDIPDFSMVLSHAEHVITAVQDDVTINCFYTQNKEGAEQRLSIAKDVVRFYRDLYGFYPGTWLNIVAYDRGGGGGGPVGSNIVYVLKDKLSWGVAHEIGHEYWGWSWVTGVPDTDPTRTWLCLGMGLWSDQQYMQARNMPSTVYSNMLNEYLDAARSGFNTKLENTTEKDLKSRMHDKHLLHDKGYAIALMLEDLLGKDVLREIAKRTLEQFAHRAIDTKDFQAVCEEISGQKLGWFFHQWVYTSDSLDYAVVDAKTTQVDSKQQVAVSIEAKGSARMPVDVLLELTDGSDVRKRVARNEQRCTFTSDKPWRRVIVDPDKYLPDTNRFDNTMVALDGQVGEDETRAVEEFRRTKKKILAGQKYEDTSTPLGAFLTVLSQLHARDANGFKRIKALSHDDENLDPKPTDEQMAGLQQSYAELDILRTPLPPGQPEGDTYWPIYMSPTGKKRKNTKGTRFSRVSQLRLRQSSSSAFEE